ncbi:DUF6355 family natural product biosynthesis protein [Amycolatopsis halotolerans]|uniref:DUF6355 family natural product biosynthesis protein n=1 Tax=Amycolatopsis halotolerans TaxID=330083 RepID=A0ABV7QYK6_9PSEU
MKKRFLFAAASAALAVATCAPAAEASPASPCGFSRSGSNSFYNHCGNDWAWIFIDYSAPNLRGEYCFKPHSERGVGQFAGDPRGAWYTRTATTDGTRCTNK